MPVLKPHANPGQKCSEVLRRLSFRRRLLLLLRPDLRFEKQEGRSFDGVDDLQDSYGVPLAT